MTRGAGVEWALHAMVTEICAIVIVSGRGGWEGIVE